MSKYSIHHFNFKQFTRAYEELKGFCKAHNNNKALSQILKDITRTYFFFENQAQQDQLIKIWTNPENRYFTQGDMSSALPSMYAFFTNFFDENNPLPYDHKTDLSFGFLNSKQEACGFSLWYMKNDPHKWFASITTRHGNEPSQHFITLLYPKDLTVPETLGQAQACDNASKLLDSLNNESVRSLLQPLFTEQGAVNTHLAQAINHSMYARQHHVGADEKNAPYSLLTLKMERIRLFELIQDVKEIPSECFIEESKHEAADSPRADRLFNALKKEITVYLEKQTFAERSEYEQTFKQNCLAALQKALKTSALNALSKNLTLLTSNPDQATLCGYLLNTPLKDGLFASIAPILKKRDNLNERDQKDASDATETLYESLQQEFYIYLSKSPTQRTEYAAQFNKNCLNAINTAKKTLGKHRSWKSFFINLTAFLCSGIVIYLAAGATKKYFDLGNGRFRLFNSTPDSEAIVEDCKSTIEEKISALPIKRAR